MMLGLGEDCRESQFEEWTEAGVHQESAYTGVFRKGATAVAFLISSHSSTSEAS